MHSRLPPGFEDLPVDEALRASEERFRRLAETAGDGILTIDEESTILFSNQAVERIFGYSARELRGQKLTLLMPPPLQARHTAALERYLATGEKSLRWEGTEFPARHKSGAELAVEVAFGAFTAGGRRFFTGFVRDVGEHRQAEDALRAQREELRALNERLRALSARLLQIREDERAAMSREIHDQLGQALIGLRFHVAALRQTPPESSEALRAKLGEVMAIADSTMVMVRNLAADLRPVVLDSLGLAAAVEWQAREVARRSGLKVEVDLHIGPLWPRRELSTAVYRCLQEALVNVERHAAASQVKVWLAADHQLLVLEIHDDGRGIRPEEIQGPASLGLLGMRERAAAFGGEVMLHGEAGRGTVVRVEVPLTPGDHGGESA
jgi:PAS domain S-box-containing protein